MLVLLVDAAALMVLLKVFSDQDLEFLTAALTGFLASVGTSVLAFALGTFLGVAGAYLAIAISALLLGAAISAIFGVDLKRSMLIAAIFLAIHLGATFGLLAIIHR